jgi:hypothetical protein
VRHELNMSGSQLSHTTIFVRDVRFSPVRLAARIYQHEALLGLFCLYSSGISMFVLDRFSEASETEESMAITQRMASISLRLAVTP